jgi:hypothetical protein
VGAQWGTISPAFMAPGAASVTTILGSNGTTDAFDTPNNLGLATLVASQPIQFASDLTPPQISVASTTGCAADLEIDGQSSTVGNSCSYNDVLIRGGLQYGGSTGGLEVWSSTTHDASIQANGSTIYGAIIRQNPTTATEWEALARPAVFNMTADMIWRQLTTSDTNTHTSDDQSRPMTIGCTSNGHWLIEVTLIASGNVTGMYRKLFDADRAGGTITLGSGVSIVNTLTGAINPLSLSKTDNNTLQFSVNGPDASTTKWTLKISWFTA